MVQSMNNEFDTNEVVHMLENEARWRLQDALEQATSSQSFKSDLQAYEDEMYLVEMLLVARNVISSQNKKLKLLTTAPDTMP